MIREHIIKCLNLGATLKQKSIGWLLTAAATASAADVADVAVTPPPIPTQTCTATTTLQAIKGTPWQQWHKRVMSELGCNMHYTTML